MPQQVHRPPSQEPALAPSSPAQATSTNRRSILLLLTLLGLLCVLFLGLVVASWPQALSPATPARSQQSFLLKADNTEFASLQLAGNRALMYAVPGGIMLLPVGEGEPHFLNTPGYRYNRAVPPLLTAGGQVVYSGDGIWLLDPVAGQARRIVEMASDRVITSLALGADGTTLAWSSAPRDGKGTVEIYTGSLEQIGEASFSSPVFQQEAGHCPCFRVFAWLPVSAADTGSSGTLLLTNDRGDTDMVRDGLWRLELGSSGAGTPQQILPGDPPQGPLALSSHDNLLLYTHALGYVVLPQDGSVPGELATEAYANDLALGSLDSAGTRVQAAQTIVAPQPLREVRITREPVHYQSTPTSTDYHWIATPRFSPDGSQVAYVQFTSDREAPFRRQSALYLVQVHGAGPQFSLSPAQLQAIAPDGYFELGSWLDEHTLTLVTKDSIYALDIQQRALAKIATTGMYGSVVAVIA